MKVTSKLNRNPNEFLPRRTRPRPDLVLTKRQVIYRQSDIARELFFIVEGEVKLSVKSAHGREAVTSIFVAGDYFGEGVIGDQKRRVSTATSISPCRLVRVARSDMLALLRNEQVFARGFVTYLISKNGRTQENLLAQLFDSTEKRLARALLQLARFGTDRKPEPVISQMSQETLARMIGATRSHVNTLMAGFRKHGHIEHHGPRKWKVNRSLNKILQAA